MDRFVNENKMCSTLTQHYNALQIASIAKLVFERVFLLSGDLRSGHVNVSNGQKEVGFQMVWISNGI